MMKLAWILDTDDTGDSSVLALFTMPIIADPKPKNVEYDMNN